ncbi:hypothetical protein AWB83_00645 [Caballeronia ptereochthonis]|jgi:hypothetical protein|uniref:Uncharacterized protein n=1 Tax=Caballeronia ptereochthonis TaxID=1777144 RepID=A0A157ZJ93_9BURK|nr:hypothetical protein AWB83_00645 [Caballeronia ptereochthonis]
MQMILRLILILVALVAFTTVGVFIFSLFARGVLPH